MHTKKTVQYKIKNRKYTLLYESSKRGISYYTIFDEYGHTIATSVPYEDTLERCQLDRIKKTTFSKRRNRKKPSKETKPSRINSLNYCSLSEFLDFTSDTDFIPHEFLKSSSYF